MRSFRAASLAVLLLVVAARPAHADATLFLGANTTPTNRPVVGGSLGAGLLIVAFEFEYSSASEDTKTGAPGLKAGTGNFLLQTPLPIFGFQPYVAAGAGVYRERVGTSAETGLTSNVGFGAKISLAGPLRLRVDYRAFRLGDSARYSPSHRIYAGLNLKF
jgi:hypothetical protein